MKRYVVGHDLHYPKINVKTWSCMLAVIADIHPAGFIFGGDQFDNTEISHHNRNKPLYKERRAYKKNEEGFEKDILGTLDKALGKTAEKTWIVGNHDDWEFQFIEEHPELDGVIDRVKSLKLVQRGWEIIPLGHSKRIGTLEVIHGEILTGVGNQAGMYPSRKAVELYGSNVLAGHTHAPQSFSKVSPVEQKKKSMGWIAPILANTNPDYLRNRPTAWVNGFTVVELHGDSRAFNLYPVVVTDGRCGYGGREYRG
jgi:hypothetical protein